MTGGLDESSPYIGLPRRFTHHDGKSLSPNILFSSFQFKDIGAL